MKGGWRHRGKYVFLYPLTLFAKPASHSLGHKFYKFDTWLDLSLWQLYLVPQSALPSPNELELDPALRLRPERSLCQEQLQFREASKDDAQWRMRSKISRRS